MTSEVDRVNHIHSNLLKYHDALSLLDLNGIEHTYTRQEVTDFVRLLPEMRKRLSDERIRAKYARLKPLAPSGVAHGAELSVCPDDVRTRGLYLTREMALYAEPQVTPFGLEPMAKALKSLYPSPELDPRPADDAEVGAMMTARDSEPNPSNPSNLSNRDYLVSQLAKEMGRPVTPPRFPSEARSCRTYKVNR